jgi:hypothetical protein
MAKSVGAEHEDNSIQRFPLKISRTKRRKLRREARLHPYTRCHAPSPQPRYPQRPRHNKKKGKKNGQNNNYNNPNNLNNPKISRIR